MKLQGQQETQQGALLQGVSFSLCEQEKWKRLFLFLWHEKWATGRGDLPACLDIRLEINQSCWKHAGLEGHEGDRVNAQFHITQLELG